MYLENHKTHQVLFLDSKDQFLKESYSSKVYNLLKKAYQVCGGINIGRGFKNETDMIKTITLWRVTFNHEKIVSVMMFKKKQHGYKMVAYATFDEIETDIRNSDIHYMMNNSYAELSGSLLVIILKHLGVKWENYILNFNEIMEEKVSQPIMEFLVKSKIPKNSKKIYERLSRDWPKIIEYGHIRYIGSEYKIKVLMGTTNTF